MQQKSREWSFGIPEDSCSNRLWIDWSTTIKQWFESLFFCKCSMLYFHYRLRILTASRKVYIESEIVRSSFSPLNSFLFRNGCWLHHNNERLMIVNLQLFIFGKKYEIFVGQDFSWRTLKTETGTMLRIKPSVSSYNQSFKRRYHWVSSIYFVELHACICTYNISRCSSPGGHFPSAFSKPSIALEMFAHIEVKKIYIYRFLSNPRTSSILLTDQTAHSKSCSCKWELKLIY